MAGVDKAKVAADFDPLEEPADYNSELLCEDVEDVVTVEMLTLAALTKLVEVLEKIEAKL